MYISGCGILAKGGGGGWDPDGPGGGKVEESLVMRGTRWGALSSAGKRMASKETIFSIMAGSLRGGVQGQGWWLGALERSLKKGTITDGIH